MKKLIVLTLILVGCEANYWGLVPDTIIVDATVDLDSSSVHVRLVKKYMSSPVTSATVLLNSGVLLQIRPGEYSGPVDTLLDTFRLRVETLDDLLDTAEIAPSPRNIRFTYRFSSDTLRVSWQKAVKNGYYEIKLLDGGVVLFDKRTSDTTVVLSPATGDTLNLEITAISGPSLENNEEVENINKNIWEGYFRVKKTTFGVIHLH